MFGRKAVAIRAMQARWDRFVRRYPQVAWDLKAWCDAHGADEAYVLVTGYCVDDGIVEPLIALEIRTEDRKASRHITWDQLELFQGNLVFAVLEELARSLERDAGKVAREEG
jgi:hypothetical protein